MYIGMLRSCLLGAPTLAFGRYLQKGKLSFPACGKIFWRTTTTFPACPVLGPSTCRVISVMSNQFLKTSSITNPHCTLIRSLSRSNVTLPFEKEFKITKNVLVFSHNNVFFYKLLSYFGAIQFIFWSYLALFSYSTLRDVSPVDDGKDSSVPWWRLINLGKNKYKNGIALLCFSVGYIVLFITVMYPLRAVHSLWLLKGGKTVGIRTYAPFGKKQSRVYPLEHINCVQSRTQAKTQVPIKVKGKWFFYLLDQKGTFHNPELFDYTVGLRRRLK